MFCSSFTHFFDAGSLSLCSYLFLPFVDVKFIWLLLCYSFLSCFISVFSWLFIVTVLSCDVYLYTPLLVISLNLYVFRYLAS